MQCLRHFRLIFGSHLSCHVLHLDKQHYVVARLQPTMSNGCVPSITADHTTSQTLCPPLPSSVQFDNNSDGENLLKPTVRLASFDMTLSLSTKQLKVLVTGCVKQQLFRRVKFFDDDLHRQFDHHPDSVCGMVRKYCNVSGIETKLNWWYETRGKIKRTLGNHRNNCIKLMRLCFPGKFYQRLGQRQYIALLMLLVQMENMAR